MKIWLQCDAGTGNEGADCEKRSDDRARGWKKSASSGGDGVDGGVDGRDGDGDGACDVFQ